MRELVEAIAKALVDNPDQVQVHAIEGEQLTVFELRVHASAIGNRPARGALPRPSAQSLTQDRFFDV